MFIFSKIDFLGVPATLNFFGNEKRKSNFGGICSLLFLGFLTWALYNSSLDLFNRTNPKIALSEINVEDPKEIDIPIDIFPIAFIIQLPTALGGSGYTNESIYTVEAQHTVIQRVKQPDGSIKKVTTNTPLQVEKCTKEYFGEYASSFSTFTFIGSYCLVRNQPGLDKLKLQGIYSSTIYQMVSATVKQCINGTSDVVCGTPEEINRQLSGSFFNAVYMDNMMNIQNYSNPTGKYREIYETMMNPNSYKEINLDVGPIQISTDSGMIIEQFNTVSSLKVNRIAEVVDLNPSPDKALVYCYFQGSRMETYYTRSYKKIPTVLAEVGGLCNVFLAILLILISPYLRLKSKEALMNELFDFDGLGDSQRKKVDLFEQKTNSNTKKGKKMSLKQDLLVTERNKTISELITPRETANKKLPNEIQISPRLTSEEYIASEIRSQDSPISPQKLVLSPHKTEEIQPQLSFPSPRALTMSSRTDSNVRRLIPDIPSSYKIARREPDESGEFENDIEKQLNHVDIDVKEKEEGNGEAVEEEKVVIEMPELVDTDRNEELEKQDILVEKGLKRGPSQFKTTTKKSSATKGDDIDRTELHIWEYILSFACKPKHLRTKIGMIEEGVRNIEERLDVSNILKKFCEVDKLIALLLDRDQLELFNSMPKPRLQSRNRDINLEKKSTFEDNLLKKINSVRALNNIDFMQKSYERIKQKPEKSEIDKRLIAIFKHKFVEKI